MTLRPHKELETEILIFLLVFLLSLDKISNPLPDDAHVNGSTESADCESHAGENHGPDGEPAGGCGGGRREHEGDAAQGAGSGQAAVKVALPRPASTRRAPMTIWT